jgi:tRNA threonylcarbamoyladenosine biosynthesis protein TsaE
MERFLTNAPEGPFIELVSDSPDSTFAVGTKIAPLLSGGSVIALEGNLGSGKTCLAKGIASGLGIMENLTSPTYTIISEYSGSPALYHIDAYRLNNDEDFENIGGSEIINSGGISIIEWSDKIKKSLPENTIMITIKITGPSSRSILIHGLERL